jgi:hypothetical protein
MSSPAAGTTLSLTTFYSDPVTTIILTLPLSNSSPAPSSATKSTAAHGLKSGTIAGIAIAAAAAVLLILLVGFCLVRRRRRRLPSTSVHRTESTGYKKAELEGTIVKNTFSKAELPVTHGVTPPMPNDVPLNGPVAARIPGSSTAYQEMEAVSASGQRSSHHQAQWSSRGPSRLEQTGSTPTESSQSGAATEEAGFLRRRNEENSFPTYTAITEPSTQDQAAVDASQLNKLKAEERELSEYIEAHETLQKLKNEHIALQERINAAEKRVQRSKAVGKD